LYTSNFKNYYIINELLSKRGLSITDRSVAISGWAPVRFKDENSSGERFQGRHYKKLAPKWWFYKKYIEDGDKDFYIRQYYNEVLSKLEAKEIYEDLGKNSIMLCWEEPGEFCHRRLDADWLNQELGGEIPEIQIEKFLLKEYNIIIPNISEEIKSIADKLDIRYPELEPKITNKYEKTHDFLEL
jgi:hypothetical protein